MSFALKNTKFRWLTAILLAVMLLLGVSACAENNLEMTLSCDPAALSGAGTTTVSIRVVNQGAAMKNAVMLHDPNGQLVTSFGDGGQAILGEGEFVTCTHNCTVSEAQLSDGKLTYTLTYSEDGIIRDLSSSAVITRAAEEAKLTANRTVEPEVVRSGETVTVLYELVNAGNVEITNIRVRENASIGGIAQTVASLAPGERKTVKFTATMGYKDDLTSEGTITYKIGEGSTSMTVPAVTVPMAKPGLVTEDMLTADNTAVEIGETVTLTFKLVNNGNITYSNIKVTDPTYGEIFSGLTLNPGETLIREKQYTLNASASFKFTVTLPDNTGNTKTVTSNELKISAYNPAQVLRMTVAAEPAAYTIARVPGDMTFNITVTNNSAKTVKNVAVKHGTVTVYTIASLEPGTSVTIARDFTLSQAGKYRFTASVKDELGNINNFESNEMNITYARPTAAPTEVPVLTVAPLVTVTVAPIEVLEPMAVQTSGILLKVIYGLGGLFAAMFLLFLVATIVRAVRRGASARAIDSFEVGTRRDYTETAKDREEEIPEFANNDTDTAPAPAQQVNDNGAYHLSRQAEESAADNAGVYQRRNTTNNNSGEDE